MKAIGSWFLRVHFTVLGALAGLIVIGLPGFRTVPTIDGSPVVGGYIPPEQASTIIREGKAIGSFLASMDCSCPASRSTGPSPLSAGWPSPVIALALFSGLFARARPRMSA